MVGGEKIKASLLILPSKGFKVHDGGGPRQRGEHGRRVRGERGEREKGEGEREGGEREREER